MGNRQKHWIIIIFCLVVMMLDSAFCLTAEDKTPNLGPHATSAKKNSKDHTQPTVVISVVAPTGNNGWYNQPVSLMVLSWDSGSGIKDEKIKVGNGPWYGKSVTLRKDGRYSVTASATDRAGNSSSRTVYIKIDMTPPDAIFHIPQADGGRKWYRKTVPVELTGTDELSGMFSSGLTIVGQIIDEGYESTNDPETINENGLPSRQIIITGDHVNVSTVRASMVESGIYRINGFVQDEAGNVTRVESLVKIDQTAPGIQIQSPDTFYGQISLTGPIIDYGSGVQRVFIDTGSGWNLVTFSDGKWETSLDTAGLKDGKYLIRAKVVDYAGNESEADYTIEVMNHFWSIAALTGVVLSLGWITLYDPRRKAWQDLVNSLAKYARMDKNARSLAKELK